MNKNCISLEHIIKRFFQGWRIEDDFCINIKETIINHFEKSNDLIKSTYDNVIWEDICKEVLKFNKEILLYICEFTRETVCMNQFPKDALDIMMGVNEVAIILQKAIFQNWNEFSKKEWYINPNYLCALQERIYLYKVVKQNLEFNKSNNIAITKQIFEPNEDEKYQAYFFEKEKYFRSIKIEEETIHDVKLREYLDNHKLLPSTIKSKSNYILDNTLGFNLEHLKQIEKALRQELDFPGFRFSQSNNVHTHHVIIKKSDFERIFCNDMDLCNITSIIKFFSINNLYTAKYVPNERFIELRCITEIDDTLHFGIYNFLECICIFDNICFNGHFISELGIPKTSENAFSKIQNKFSTFFSYKIADLLDEYGYTLPKDNEGIILVELKKLPIADNKSISINDIDVLALDEDNHILYNFELKHFKPTMSYSKITTDKFSNDLYENFISRNKILQEHMNEILTMLFKIKTPSNYKLSPIVITSRPSFNSKNNGLITYYNYESFKENFLLKKSIY